MSVRFIEKSANRKISGKLGVSATYAPISQTCPSTCELKKEGCYARLSFVGIVNARLEGESVGLSPLQVAKAEAKAIDGSFKGGAVRTPYLRLHVSGDARTVKAATILASAVERWQARGGVKAWSYTHAWRKVPRKAWGAVSVLASVATVAEAEQARKAGYAPAIIVGEHASPKAFKKQGSRTLFIPCPAQTQADEKNVSCESCRLCMDSERLFASNMGIAFAAHGAQKSNIKRRLNVLR